MRNCRSRSFAPFRPSLPGFFQFLSHQHGAVLNDVLIFGSESSREVAVDIQFAHYFPTNKDWDDNFGLSFKGTSEITWVFADVVDNDCPAAGSGSAADTLIERNSSVRRHGPFEGIEHEHGRLRSRFEHVEAHPVVFEHALVQKLDHLLHENMDRGRRLCQFGDLVTNFLDPRSYGHQTNLNSRSRIRDWGNGPNGNLTDSFRTWKSGGGDGVSQRVESLKKRGRVCV